VSTYFVRISGSDSNAGTSAGAAFRTIGKALGATGIGNGDTVYIGAGTYRETVTVATAGSFTVPTFVIGDVDGARTGDAGEVIWTNYLNGWYDTPAAVSPLNLAGKRFFTLKNLHIVAGGANSAVNANTPHSGDMVFDTCVLVSFNSAAIAHTPTAGQSSNWTITNCQVVSTSGIQGILFTFATGLSVDWDSNIQIVDSLVWCTSAQAIAATSSGTNSFEGGGVDVLRCTLIGTVGFSTLTSRVGGSVLQYPCTVQDCLILATTNLAASEAGNLLDLGGNVGVGAYTNMTAHATSKLGSNAFPAPFLSFAHEWMWGMAPRRLLAPMVPGVLARGILSAGTTDIEGRPRPEGIGRFIDSGTVTSASSTGLTDTSKAWATDEHKGRLVRTTGGTGPNQVKHISNSGVTTLTIGGLSGDWAITPDTTTTYMIYEGPPVETNKATSGSTTTFVVSGAAWSVNKWAGYSLEITAGAQSGTTRTIVSNTSTTLTVAAFPGAIDSTSVGSIYWPSTSLTATQRTPGALEGHDTARKETTTTDAGGVGIVLNGPSSQEISIPVDAVSTMITVKARYDTDHGTTNKPQAILVANGEIGVVTETRTMTSGAGTWDLLTFSTFTPTAPGVVTVRLVSRSDVPWGRAFFDTFTVT